jgi:hypothetical protein
MKEPLGFIILYWKIIWRVMKLILVYICLQIVFSQTETLAFYPTYRFGTDKIPAPLPWLRAHIWL